MPIAQHLKLRLFLEGIETPIVSASESIQGNKPAQCNVQIPATERSHELHPKTLVHIFFRDLYDGPSDAAGVSGSEAPAVISAEEVLLAHQERINASRASLSDIVLETSRTNTQVNEDGVASRLSPPPITLPNPFVSDPNDPNPSLLQKDSGSGRLGPVPEWSDELVTQLSARAWRVFFIGEVMGYGFSKSVTQRSCVLNCLDPSNYWDTCYQYKVNLGRLTGNGLANFVGAGTSLYEEFFQGSESLLIQILKRNSKTRPELTGLLSGIVHLLERVGGVYTDGGFRGVNDYFSLAELRLHLIDMISASSNDESSRRLAGRRAYNRFLRREGGRLGQISSFREVLNMINRFIFHEVYPNPIAKYDPPADQAVARTRLQSQPILDSVAGQQLKVTLEQMHVIAALTNAAIAVAKNVQSEIAQLMFLEQRDPAATRQFSSVPAATTALQTATAQAAENMRNFFSASQRGTAQARQIHRRDLAHLVTVAGAHARISANYFDRGQVAKGSAQLESAMIALPSIEGLSGAHGSRAVRSTRLVEKSPRLHSQIIRPDVWMVAPPRCNVLFPELLSSMDYSRQFMREATRLRLTVTDEVFGSDQLLNQLYYAPDIAVEGLGRRQVSAGSRRGSQRGRQPSLQQAAYSRRLMNHELFTGVIPVFERLNEVNVFAAQTDPVSHRGAQVPYITRAAHFQFFKHRFSPRTLSVSGKFNPYIVAGFPAVVIDRYMTHDQVIQSNVRGLEMLSYLDSQYDRLAAHEQMRLPTLGLGFNEIVVKDVLRQTEGGTDLGALTTIDDIWTTLRLNTPTQFIGMVVAVTHTVSQNSANTQYQLQYARTHRESEDALGANAVDLTARESGTTITTYVVAAREGYPPTVGQTGSNYGEITGVRELFRTGEFMLFGTFRPNTVRGINRRTRSEVKVPVGILQPAARYQSAEVLTLVGSETEEVQFRAYEITELVQRSRGDTIVVPFEDFVRPSWISDVWKNSQIGATYLQMLGVGAITDDMVFEASGEQGSSNSANTEPALLDNDMRARNDTATAGWSKDGTGSQEADKIVTVERAIDLLIRAYSDVKHRGLDVHEFIRSYIWRPVATLTEILGSSDLEINPDTGVAEVGEKGFHSLAFGHGAMGQNLRNLIPENSTSQRILGIRTGNRDRAAELSKLDKRKEKSDRVLAYVEELRNNRALLG